ncbi:hypothetical protein MP228_003713 [Amoeboaphelidium protococcarum]|nr:hypothetical protein MP228_003713 [Amoeboaphelidium protococcarum]
MSHHDFIDDELTRNVWAENYDEVEEFYNSTKQSPYSSNIQSPVPISDEESLVQAQLQSITIQSDSQKDTSPPMMNVQLESTSTPVKENVLTAPVSPLKQSSVATLSPTTQFTAHQEPDKDVQQDGEVDDDDGEQEQEQEVNSSGDTLNSPVAETEFQQANMTKEEQQQLIDNLLEEAVWVDVPDLKDILDEQERIAFAGLVLMIIRKLAHRFARFQFVDLAALQKHITQQQQQSNANVQKSKDSLLYDYSDQESSDDDDVNGGKHSKSTSSQQIVSAEPYESEFYTHLHAQDNITHLVYIGVNVTANTSLAYAVNDYLSWGNEFYDSLCKDLEIDFQEQHFIESSLQFMTMSQLKSNIRLNDQGSVQKIEFDKDGQLTGDSKNMSKMKRTFTLWNIMILLMQSDRQRANTSKENDNLVHKETILLNTLDCRSRQFMKMLALDCLGVDNCLDVVEFIESPLKFTYLASDETDDFMASSDQFVTSPTSTTADAFTSKPSDNKTADTKSRERTESERNRQIADKKLAAKNKRKRVGMMTAAAIGGGLMLGVSAGLAAPLLVAGLGTALTAVHVAGASAFLSSVGGTALITSSATLFGTSYAGYKMGKRTADVQVFKFIPLQLNTMASTDTSQAPAVIISIAGWVFNKKGKSARTSQQTSPMPSGSSQKKSLLSNQQQQQHSEQSTDETLACGLEDLIIPFVGLSAINGAHYSLCFDPHILSTLGDALKMFASELVSFSTQQILQQTVLSTLMSGLTWPLWLIKLSYLVDNPWSMGLDRAQKSGYLLADSLCNNIQNSKPVTLVGYSLGARVIFYCLLELAKRGKYGIVQDVYLFGTPILTTHVTLSNGSNAKNNNSVMPLNVEQSDPFIKPENINSSSPNAYQSLDEWRSAISVVGGRLFNCFSRVDWVLGFLLRASVAGLYDVAGLSPVILDETETPDVITLFDEMTEDEGRQRANVEAEVRLKSTSRLLVNVDITDVVTGHLQYSTKMPQLARRVCGFATWSESTEVLQEIVAGSWLDEIDGWWSEEKQKLSRKQSKKSGKKSQSKR